MKYLFLALVLSLASFVTDAQAQTVTSFSTTVSVVGTGFAAGDIVTASPSGDTCSNVVVASSTLIHASCPNGTTSVSVKKKVTTYPFVLLFSWTAPSTGTFNWTVGSSAPPAQTLFVYDSSVCPPPTGIPYCAWPNTTVRSDSSWLVVSPSSGTTAFNVTVSINTAGLSVGSHTGNIIVTQNLFTTPTLSVPVTLTVTGTHAVNLSWNASQSTNVTGYQVLRSATSGSGYQQVGTTASLVYSDTTVSPGTYYYVVRASAPACPAAPTCGVSANSNQATAVVP